MGQSTVTELLDFTGGMNTLVAPHLISKREATRLVNVDIRLGSLQSMPNLDFVEVLPLGPYFYQFNREVQTYPTYRDNVTWDNRWYWSDGLTTGKQLEDGSQFPLGLPTPIQTLTQTPGALTNGALTGDFKYTYTFYSTQTNAESAPAPLPNYLTVVNNEIILDNFEALPAGADAYRLYRIGGYVSLFTMVDQITIVPYTDNLDDTSIDGRLLQTLFTAPPPANLINLLELNGRFYGSVGNKVFYSALGNPDAWYDNNFIEVRETIVALAKSPNGLLIMGQFFTSALIGNQPENFRLKLLSDVLGCVGRESVAYIADSAIWLSHTAFCMSNGYKVIDITANKMDRINGIFPTGAAVLNETYYVAFKPSLFPETTLYPSPTLYPNDVDGTSGVDQGLIAIDFKRGNGYSIKIIEYESIQYIGLIDGEIHLGIGDRADGGVLCDETVFPSCLDFLACSPFSLNTMNVYAGQGLTELQYISPRLIDGSRATLKEYDKVRILFKGIFDVAILFDNGVVALTQRIFSPNELDSFTLLGIPNAKNKSYHIRFSIRGVGTIESIQYSWKTRELVN